MLATNLLLSPWKKPTSRSTSLQIRKRQSVQLHPQPSTLRNLIVHLSGALFLCRRVLMWPCTHKLFRWTESISQRIKRRRKVPEHARMYIWQSVFEPTYVSPFVIGGIVGILNSKPDFSNAYVQVKTLDHKSPMTQAGFDE